MNHSLKEIIHWKTNIWVFIISEIFGILLLVIAYTLPSSLHNLKVFKMFVIIINLLFIAGIILSIFKYKSKKFFFIELLIYEPNYREENNIKIVNREIYINNEEVNFKQLLIYLLPRYPVKTSIENNIVVLLKTRYITWFIMVLLLWLLNIFFLIVIFTFIFAPSSHMNVVLQTQDLIKGILPLLLIFIFPTLISLWIPPSWTLLKSYFIIGKQEKGQNIKFREHIKIYLNSWKQVKGESNE